MVSNDFSDEFEDHVAESNWTKILCGGSLLSLWMRVRNVELKVGRIPMVFLDSSTMFHT